MNIEVKQQDINVSFADKSAPTFKLENENVNATLEKQDVNFYLEKHPEIKVFFESKFVSGGSIKVLTQEEYDALSDKPLTTIFLVIENGDLSKVYFGTFLLAQKGENGFFPYTLPITF